MQVNWQLAVGVSSIIYGVAFLLIWSTLFCFVKRHAKKRRQLRRSSAALVSANQRVILANNGLDNTTGAKDLFADIKEKIKILYGFGQVTQSFYSNILIAWPEELKQLGRILSTPFSLSLFPSEWWHCAYPTSYLDKLFFYVLVATSVLSLFPTAKFLVHRCVSSRHLSARQRDLFGHFMDRC